MTEMLADEFQQILMETGLLRYAGTEHAELHTCMAELFNGVAQAYYAMGVADTHGFDAPGGHC